MSGGGGSRSEGALQKFIVGNLVVVCDIGNEPPRVPNRRAVAGHGDVVLTFCWVGHPHMAAGLVYDLVAQFAKRCGEIIGQVTRQFHTAKSSSRTKCRRTTLGC